VTERPGPGDTLAEEAAAKVRATDETVPRAAIVMGSGLGDAATEIDARAEILYTDLPGFPAPTVPGHAGRLLLGELGSVPVAAFLGRVHYYEGHGMELVTLPTRLAAALGAEAMIATASVGGLEVGLEPGSLVVGRDHLNFMGESPLRGWRDAEGRPTFVDMTRAYDRDLSTAAIEAAEAIGLPVSRGVYAANAGPAYETPAEVAYLRGAGASVVGMSIVPEAMAAAALGMRFAGFFCVTNKLGEAVSHTEVTDVAAAFAPRLAEVLRRVVQTL
jgi:purine-nucleoside phosphorylase